MAIEESLQGLFKETAGSDWWEKGNTSFPRRGQLVWTFVPIIDNAPLTLVPEGRTEATEHGKFAGRLETLRVKDTKRAAKLPVAAMPIHTGEVRAVYRAKTRPALVVSCGGTEIPKDLKGGASPRWQTAHTLLVAPYYGVDHDGKRAGWNPKFVDRVRRCEFPQVMLDALPIPGDTKTSILRLDQIQPVAATLEAVEITEFALSPDAVEFVLDDWLSWIITGNLPANGILDGIRKALMTSSYSAAEAS